MLSVQNFKEIVKNPLTKPRSHGIIIMLYHNKAISDYTEKGWNPQMKKIVALILAAVMCALCLAGCGAKKETLKVGITEYEP